MDPGTLAALLHERPAELDQRAAVFAGAVAPVVVPAAWLPPMLRARLYMNDPRVPIADRVDAALQAGLAEDAWGLLVRRPEPMDRDPALELALQRWAEAERQRLGLPAGSAGVLVLGETDALAARSLAADAAAGCAAAQELLEGIALPRWAGPLVIVVGPRQDLMPADTRFLARPALPLLRAPAAGAGPRREAIADAWTRMALALSGPPPRGWPAWLEEGLCGCARARARGEGPSPLGMLAERQRAGRQAIEALLVSDAGAAVDRGLAAAVCAPLVHTRRRHLLGGLLDLVRNGAGGPGAIARRYDLTIDRLLTER